MSPPITFSPRHTQPFTLEQAMLLEVDTLVAEIARLENSLNHLRETQAELESFLKEDPDGDEDGELAKAMMENNQVIESQRERVTLIKVALLNKVGEGGVRHMGLDLSGEEAKRAADVIRDPDASGGGAGDARTAEEGEGVFL